MREAPTPKAPAQKAPARRVPTPRVPALELSASEAFRHQPPARKSPAPKATAPTAPAPEATTPKATAPTPTAPATPPPAAPPAVVPPAAAEVRVAAVDPEPAPQVATPDPIDAAPIEPTTDVPVAGSEPPPLLDRPWGLRSWSVAAVSMAAALGAGIVLLSPGQPAAPEAAQSRPAAFSATPTSAAPLADLAAKASKEAAAESARSATLDSMRGLGQDLSWWNAAFPAAPISACAAAGEWAPGQQPGPNAGAWKLPGGALVCAAPAPAWEGRVVGLDVFFPRPVAESAAVSAAASLLPTDSLRARTLPGHNAVDPAASCQHVSFSSVNLGSAVELLTPDRVDPQLTEITLYSHLPTAEGSDSPYKPRSVHLARIRLGETTVTNPDGTAGC